MPRLARFPRSVRFALCTLVTVAVCCAARRTCADIVQGVGDVAEIWANNPVVGQTFTIAPNDLFIEKVSFLWSPNSSVGDPIITVRLYSGSGYAGTLLGTKAVGPIPNNTTPAGTWIDFAFAAPVPLLTGQLVYTLQFTRNPNTFSGAYMRSSSNVYAGGAILNDVGVANPSVDMAFRVFTIPEAAAWQFVALATAIAVAGSVWTRRGKFLWKRRRTR